jgi:hypothetical protein
MRQHFGFVRSRRINTQGLVSPDRDDEATFWIREESKDKHTRDDEATFWIREESKDKHTEMMRQHFGFVRSRRINTMQHRDEATFWIREESKDEHTRPCFA